MGIRPLTCDNETDRRGAGNASTVLTTTANLMEAGALMADAQPIQVPTSLSPVYTAGLFDGEGHVAIQKSSGRSWCLRSGVAMSYRPIIDELHQQFGGSFCVNDHASKNYGRRLIYQWTVTGYGAVEFLEFMRPHLVVKRAEVDHVLEYMAARPDGRVWRKWSDGMAEAEAIRAMDYRDRLRAMRG